jgi:hypothetical protein
LNTETGAIRQLREGETLRQNEIEVHKPNPLCPRCHGKGTYLTDVTKDPINGNRAQRRLLKKEGIGMKYMPCPDCTEIRKPYRPY